MVEIEHVEKLRSHVAALFGVDCNVFDVRLKTFQHPDKCFCSRCPNQCDFKNTHLYGCFESVRWDNKYIYYCPIGLIFIAVPVLEEFDILNTAVVTGPLLMGTAEDIVNTYGLPLFETARVNDLAEVLSALFSPKLAPHGLTESKEDFLNTIYKELDVLPTHKYYPIELEKALQSSIIERDGKHSRELLNKLLGQIFFHSNGDFKVIKARVLELIVLLSRSAIDGGADIDQIFSLNNDYMQEVERFNSLEKLSLWLTGVINRFVSYVFEFGDVKHTDTIYKITDYIKNNYMKKISLNDIAAHVYLSKSYVSKIFKEEMDITLSEYTNKIRIEKSKVLLLSASLTLVDVANLVGFEDQSYFSKIFKSITGVSPGKYREKHGKR